MNEIKCKLCRVSFLPNCPARKFCSPECAKKNAKFKTNKVEQRAQQQKYQKEYKEKNKEKIKETQKKYYLKNKDWNHLEAVKVEPEEPKEPHLKPVEKYEEVKAKRILKRNKKFLLHFYNNYYLKRIKNENL